MSLDSERSTSFNREGLTEMLREKIAPEIPAARLREIQEKARRIPALVATFEKYHYSREESITRGLQFGQAWKAFMDKERLNKFERRTVLGFFPELTPHLLHYEFFLPSLEIQASQAQRDKWLPLCESLEIIGCYAQTELGHGSNVRGIEIEATYDDLKQEFVMNSPTITATKWWSGGLGVACTHALVVARLKIKGQDYGPHAFLVPIRDRRTHEPFAGIEVGDIGPKMALAAADNGFLRFDSYRISKECMLNRFARVSETGEYEILDPGAIKILYLSLIRARSNLVFDAWYPLTMALTISIRYSLIREQFPDPDNPKKEKKILDYQIQQFKLFRVLARLYSLIFFRPYLRAQYAQAEQKLNAGDDSDLAYLHCIASLYKSYTTYGVVEGIEEARRSCGGHGFMMLSGLPSLYTEYLPAITYDGDNSILTLQAARYFMSLLRKPREMPEDLRFFSETSKILKGEVGTAEFHQQCFDTAARNKFRRLVAREQVLIAQGGVREKIWNSDLQIEAVEACEAVYYSSVHRFFVRGISEIQDGKIREVIETLRQIFATSELERFHGELVRAGMKIDMIQGLKDVQLEAYEKIRPNALGLIEVFEISDEALNSVIAKKDGLIYQNMIRTSKYLNPLNKEKVFPGIKQYLRPKL